MAGRDSSVIFNTREQILSGDMNALQQVASKELQDTVLGLSKGVLGGMLDAPLSLVGISSSPYMTLGAGRALATPAIVITSPDDSQMAVLRWGAQTLHFDAADSQPRIDLLVAEGSDAVDAASSYPRQILLDPVLRTVASTSVFKRQNPVAVFSIHKGTPGASPVPPDAVAPLPAGQIAVAEVYVPASAADSTENIVGPRLSRLVPTGGLNLHGVLRGVKLVWPVATNSIPGIEAGLNCALIDGEPVLFTSRYGSGNQVPMTYGDAGADPFTTVNPSSTAMRPYYLYLVGGRYVPQMTGSASTPPTKAPVAVVASLIPPDPLTGKPSSVITTPRGDATIDGALYIGIGFTRPSSTDSAYCTMTDRYVFADGYLEVPTGTFSSAPVVQTLASKPYVSHELVATLSTNPVSVAANEIRETRVGPVLPGGTFGVATLRATAWGIDGTPDFMPPMLDSGIVPLLGNTVAIQSSDDTKGDAWTLVVNGYSHHLPRFDGGLGLGG